MPTPRLVLVIEDDHAIRTGVVEALHLGGYRAIEAGDGDKGLKLALAEPVELVLLDLLLPRRDGLAVLAELRREKPGLPVVVLTARGTESDRVRGLQLGADDYCVKPFSMRELLARVAAVLRRTPERRQGLERLDLPGGLSVDFTALSARAGAGEPVALSAQEAACLRYLAEHAPRAIGREELLRRVWHVEAHGGETRCVDMCVARLREKLGGAAVRTVHGQGYALGAAANGGAA